MAHVHEEKDRLRKALLKSLSLTAFLALPISALCIVFAPEMIRLLLGHQWLAAGTPFALLTATYIHSCFGEVALRYFRRWGAHSMITMQSLYGPAYRLRHLGGILWPHDGVCVSSGRVVAMAAVAMLAAARAVDISARDILSVHARG